jgi:DNA-binding MarR family transcriptional regulator
MQADSQSPAADNARDPGANDQREGNDTHAASQSAPGPVAFDLAQFLPYRMNVLAGRISRQLAAVYGAQFGLTIPEWRILAHLSQLPPGSGDVSVREVQARVDMDKAKVTRAAQRLEAAGLISKRANPDDRRLVRLALTDVGHQRMAVLVPWVQDYETRLLDVLNADERRTFLAALDKLEAATAPRSDEDGAATKEKTGDPPGTNDPQG